MRNGLKYFLIFAGLLGSTPAFAGFIEFGFSGSYRRSNLDENDFTETKSLTASASYYFMAMSALELSYTQGLSVIETDNGSATESKTQSEFSLIGLDLVLSFGTRESSFRPYIKGGAVYIDRKIIVENSFASTTIDPDPGIAPSVGLGVKFIIGKQLSIKFGFDSWTTPLGQEPVEYNYSGKAGISWIF